MGPDETLSIPGTGEIYFVPTGSPLPVGEEIPADWVQIGLLGDAMHSLGAAAEKATDALWDFAEAMQSITLKIEGPWDPKLHQMFFGGRQPKRWRKRYDRAQKQMSKAWRLELRARQRRAIGISG